jgi:hypothetical protein
MAQQTSALKMCVLNPTTRFNLPLTISLLPPPPNLAPSRPVSLSLAIGSPLSQLELLVKKITVINGKHGPFDACVLVGDVFAPDSDGSELGGLSCKSRGLTWEEGSTDLTSVPVPTYFTIGKHTLPQSVQEKILSSGGEVTHNLVFLGGFSVFT